jgi:L-2-hydroxyglutarate oxidase LhgO
VAGNINTDVIIVGGGIVGLATAYQLSLQYPSLHITILEKEAELCFHQSGRNSGVLHSGVYYTPGSLKARNCRTGKAMMEQFCSEQDIPFELCGKVIVATREEERPALHNIYARGQANGVSCTLIDQQRLQEIEPHTAGIEAIHIPEAGIVDYRQVCQRLASFLQEQGHSVVTGAKVMAHVGQYLINCAGLQSDRVTKMSGLDAPAQIVPFRGEYYELKAEAEHLCRGLLYPVPDPSFPFLGVHFTLTISGRVECGPNAVLAFAREGYHLTDFDFADFWETLRYPGFRKLAGKYWRNGLGEMWRSASKKAFVKALQKLLPDIREEHLVRAPAGIRAQAILPDGSMVDDFSFQDSKRVVNVINAPSPAATSSLAIGNTIVDKLATRFR